MGIISRLARNPYPDLDLLDEEASANPKHLWIESTSRCNTRCRTCAHFYSTFGVDMSEAVARQVCDKALEGVREVDLVGCGEPLIARHWEMLFAACSERQIRADITTNGILLRDEELVRKLVRSHVVLAFSIDGARKETYEFVRPYIHWEDTLAALERLRRSAAEAGRERRFSLRLNFVAMKQNIADLPDMVRMARKYGASSMYVMQLSFSEDLPGLKGQSLDESPEMVAPAMLKALWLGLLFGIHVSVPPRFRELILGGSGLRALVRRFFLLAFLGLAALRGKGPRRLLEILCFGFGPESKYSKTFCSMPWTDAFIGADGTVHPCCATLPLGNLQTQAWRDIWNGEHYRNLRRTVHSWNPTRVCRFCEQPNGLNGGDRMQYGRFFAKFGSEEIPLDSIQVETGLFDPEYTPEGTLSHRWTQRRSRFSIPLAGRATFLRVRIIPLAPRQTIVSGRCSINGGPWEPFDNSCDQLHFPLNHASGERLEVRVEMAEAFRVEGDDRELALAIRGIELLRGGRSGPSGPAAQSRVEQSCAVGRAGKRRGRARTTE